VIFLSQYECTLDRGTCFYWPLTPKDLNCFWKTLAGVSWISEGTVWPTVLRSGWVMCRSESLYIWSLAFFHHSLNYLYVKEKDFFKVLQIWEHLTLNRISVVVLLKMLWSQFHPLWFLCLIIFTALFII